MRTYMTKAEEVVLNNMVNTVGKITRSMHRPDCTDMFKESAEYCCGGNENVGIDERFVIRSMLEDFGYELLSRKYGITDYVVPDIAVSLLVLLDAAERFDHRCFEFMEKEEFEYIRKHAMIFTDFAETFNIPGNWLLLRKLYKEPLC